MRTENLLIRHLFFRLEVTYEVDWALKAKYLLTLLFFSLFFGVGGWGGGNKSHLQGNELITLSLSQPGQEKVIP